MSHARFARQRYTLALDEEGGAELTLSGKTVWASDADGEFVEEFGDDLIGDYDGAANADAADELLDRVLTYLVDAHYMDDDEADDCYVRIPDDDDGEAVLGEVDGGGDEDE